MTLLLRLYTVMKKRVGRADGMSAEEKLGGEGEGV